MNLPDPNLSPIAALRQPSLQRVNGIATASQGQSSAQRELAEMLFRRLLNNLQAPPAPQAAAARPSMLDSNAGLSTLEFARRHTQMATERRAKRARGLIPYL
ncbi:Flagellar hook-length control protein FliK [Chromobacterium violaceum]|uniref:hypothetical protein n=1 Tax=Chromobacterium violaceum TaxID=536 RepID=UPI0009BB954F|nr:hypothetical protein [Chromobacterium violaceum]MBP4043641.1 hypothetical protein [Chromobacterium violaceum]MBP4051802.1 hypothetical protein [Chromobacterium violaceum]MBX9265840.1 hypothetical protein [Chromobacterium violaceum]QRO32737.1 hypothetical protein I6K04_20065 [Chromobacterium violaceum]QRQ17462.1 hypothetical protein I6K03_02660 [Chromobacterium violaceum]